MKPAYPRYLAFPFAIGSDGRTAVVGGIDQHVRDEIVQLILTGSGERLFLPTFGTNVRRQVFENATDTVTSLTKATVADALARWLGSRVHVDSLDVTFADATISVNLAYTVAGGGQNVVSFQRTVGA